MERRNYRTLPQNAPYFTFSPTINQAVRSQMNTSQETKANMDAAPGAVEETIAMGDRCVVRRLYTRTKDGKAWHKRGRRLPCT